MDADQGSEAREPMNERLAYRASSEAEASSERETAATLVDRAAVVVAAVEAMTALAAERAHDLSWLASRRNISVSDLVRELICAELDAQFDFERGRFSRRHFYRS